MTSFNPNSGRPYKNNDRQFTRQKNHSHNPQHRNRHGQHEHAQQKHNTRLEPTLRPHPHQSPQSFERAYDYNEYSKIPSPDQALALEHEHYQDHNFTQNIVSRAVAQAINTFAPLDDLNNSIDSHASFRPLLDKNDLLNHNTPLQRQRHSHQAKDNAKTTAERYPRHLKQNKTTTKAHTTVHNIWENSPQDLLEQPPFTQQKTAPASKSRKNNRLSQKQGKRNDKVKNKANQELRTTPSHRLGSSISTNTSANSKSSATSHIAAQPQTPPQTKQPQILQSRHNSPVKNRSNPRQQQARAKQTPWEIQATNNSHQNQTKAAFVTQQEQKPNKSKPPRNSKPNSQPNTIAKVIAKAMDNSYNPHVQEHDPRHLNYLVISDNSDSKNTTEPLVQTIISHQYQARESYHPQSHLRTQLISVHTAKGTVRAQTDKNIRRRPSNRRPYHP